MTRTALRQRPTMLLTKSSWRESSTFTKRESMLRILNTFKMSLTASKVLLMDSRPISKRESQLVLSREEEKHLARTPKTHLRGLASVACSKMRSMTLCLKSLLDVQCSNSLLKCPLQSQKNCHINGLKVSQSCWQLQSSH